MSDIFDYSDFNGTHVDRSYKHFKNVNRLSSTKFTTRLVPFQKEACRTPKRYAANGVRMSPLRSPIGRPYPHKTQGRKNFGGNECSLTEAYLAKQSHHVRRKTGFSSKLNSNAPEFSPSVNPMSPVGLNPAAPEFSPLASSMGMSPLAKPFTPTSTKKVGLTPLAAPFVPSSIPEDMPMMDLGQSLRSAINALKSESNIAFVSIGDKVFEIYDFASL